MAILYKLNAILLHIKCDLVNVQFWLDNRKKSFLSLLTNNGEKKGESTMGESIIPENGLSQWLTKKAFY